MYPSALSARTRLLIGAGFIGSVLAVVLIGRLVFFLEEALPSTYGVPLELPVPSDLLDGVDKSVGMMFSVTLGLFVMAGFALRSMEQPLRLSRFSILTSAAFLVGSILAVYMGFMARNVALYYASFRTPASVGLSGTFITLQAVAVALSGLCAVLLLAEHYLGRTSARVPDSGMGRAG